jgi:hypothetical protein
LQKKQLYDKVNNKPPENIVDFQDIEIRGMLNGTDYVPVLRGDQPFSGGRLRPGDGF